MVRLHAGQPTVRVASSGTSPGVCFSDSLPHCMHIVLHTSRAHPSISPRPAPALLLFPRACCRSPPSRRPPSITPSAIAPPTEGISRRVNAHPRPHRRTPTRRSSAPSLPRYHTTPTVAPHRFRRIVAPRPRDRAAIERPANARPRPHRSAPSRCAPQRAIALLAALTPARHASPPPNSPASHTPAHTPATRTTHTGSSRRGMHCCTLGWSCGQLPAIDPSDSCVRCIIVCALCLWACCSVLYVWMSSVM